MDKELERPGFWAVLPAAVRYDQDLPPMARLLYAEISALSDQRGYCFAPNEYFLKLYGMADRTLQRQLKSLETGGYIRIENGDGGAGRRRIYAGINPLAQNPDKNVGDPRQKCRGNPVKNVGENNIENNLEEHNPLKPPKGGEGEIYDQEAFEALWKLYPKKKDKAKAIKEWNKLKADRKLMRKMSAALRVQMASEEWQRDNGRAIPYLCRWLSHRRWEDEQEVRLPKSGGQEVKRVWLN